MPKLTKPVEIFITHSFIDVVNVIKNHGNMKVLGVLMTL